MTLNSSRKGKREERWWVNALNAVTGWTASRAPGILESQGVALGVDVRAACSTLALGLQVRAGARVSVWDALADARRGVRQGEVPVAACKRTHPGSMEAERVVVLGADDFLALLERLTVEAP